MTRILGLSAWFHDSSAALVADGRIVAAAQEERFTRIRHDAAYPEQAVKYCLQAAGLTDEQLDFIVYYEKPLLKFDRLLETSLAFAPRGFLAFLKSMPVWLKEKLLTRRRIRAAFSKSCRARLLFVEHHQSHAASAFFPSPFKEAAILTMDGVGEWATTAWGTGDGHTLTLEETIGFPHSLGLLYSAFTYHCGFRVNSGEYKLMGLAPYGKPVYEELIRRHLVDIRDDGSLRLNMRYFDYGHGLTMTNQQFSRLFGVTPRAPESPLEQVHMDLAASIQRVTEDVVLAAARYVHQRTGLTNLTMAGGVALNCVANGRLLKEGPFRRIWVQPAAGDAGGALGAAMFVWHQLLGNSRAVQGHADSMEGSLLGPSYSTGDIAEFLRIQGAVFREYRERGDLRDRVARLLADGKVVGWFRGRMEFGPRALGARSILGDPRSSAMQSTMNLRIKFRESFRPFAPIVTQEDATNWFDLPPGHDSPYMLLVAPVTESRRLTLTPQQSEEMHTSPDLIRRVNVTRSTIPAVTHVDHSARIQTVDRNRNPDLHALLKSFESLTGVPVLLNTSFNVRGEPIVCTPQDAWQCFLATDMDVLVLEDCVVEVKPALTAEKQRQRDLRISRIAPD